MRNFFIAIDQGTTSSRAILYDHQIKKIDTSQIELTQYYPKDGWVEHDLQEIWHSVLSCVKKLIDKNSLRPEEIISIGITNQRETVAVWDRKTQEPLAKAIVWQDRRTAGYCEKLRDDGVEAIIKEKTGLLLDPYFSASKIKWLKDSLNLKNDTNCLFGTIDTFLIWKLTDGKNFFTDVTNASRTSLFSIKECKYDDDLLRIFDLKDIELPDIKENADFFGETKLFGGNIKISGVAGDQQAALIGQTGFDLGSVKSTYGTGCFLMLNTGKNLIQSKNKLLTTIGYKINGEITYALEGSIFVAGSSIQFLRDKFKFFNSAEESEKLASSADIDSKVYLIPAFTGLGAPHWKPDAKGAIFGLTLNSGINEIALATLEAIAFQTKELLEAMESDGAKISSIKIDGGMSNNSFFSQLLADTLKKEIYKPQDIETTALGAAYLAAIGSGFAKKEDLLDFWEIDKKYVPKKDLDSKFQNWQSYLKKLI
jgi:glycerol kinase